MDIEDWGSVPMDRSWGEQLKLPLDVTEPLLMLIPGRPELSHLTVVIDRWDAGSPVACFHTGMIDRAWTAGVETRIIPATDGYVHVAQQAWRSIADPDPLDDTLLDHTRQIARLA